MEISVNSNIHIVSIYAKYDEDLDEKEGYIKLMISADSSRVIHKSLINNSLTPAFKMSEPNSENSFMCYFLADIDSSRSLIPLDVSGKDCFSIIPNNNSRLLNWEAARYTVSKLLQSIEDNDSKKHIVDELRKFFDPQISAQGYFKTRSKFYDVKPSTPKK